MKVWKPSSILHGERRLLNCCDDVDSNNVLNSTAVHQSVIIALDIYVYEIDVIARTYMPDCWAVATTQMPFFLEEFVAWSN